MKIDAISLKEGAFKVKDSFDSGNFLFYKLQKTKKPIFIYGMGNGAEKLKLMLDSYGIALSGVFASDEFVRGHEFLGHTVIKYSALPSNAVILLAFGAFTQELLMRFDTMAAGHEFYAPDLPLFGEEYFSPDFFKEHEGEIKAAYSLLSDEQSRLVFKNTALHKLTGEIRLLREMETPKSESYALLSLGENESFLDLGAYDGDTVREFLQAVNGKYDSITAVEPDSKNFAKLVKRTPQAKCLNIGVWDKPGEAAFSTEASRNSSIKRDGRRVIAVDTIDSLCHGKKVTFIKMDVEGSEAKALLGGAKTFLEQRPKLLVSAYHRTGDFFGLINLIHALAPQYRLYMRHQPYVPNWETNIIAL